MQDEDLVEKFLAQGADHVIADCVRTRHRYWVELSHRFTHLACLPGLLPRIGVLARFDKVISVGVVGVTAFDHVWSIEPS